LHAKGGIVFIEFPNSKALHFILLTTLFGLAVAEHSVN
jgi:hypothetical protein